jgi:FkbM family methyltransferase
MKEIIKKLLKRAGFELIRARPHIVNILISMNIDVVFDVGANVGQFGEYLRANGYRGKIVSFEPLREPFDVLQQKASKDVSWKAERVGLGSAPGKGMINISRYTEFSSLLEPLPLLREFAGEKLKLSATQEIAIETVDSQFDRFVGAGENTFLKIDTQGYERQVIAGAAKSMSRIAGLQLELSLTPLYAGETPLSTMVPLLEQMGFNAVLVEPVVYDKRKGILLQIDCVFLKS